MVIANTPHSVGTTDSCTIVGTRSARPDGVRIVSILFIVACSSDPRASPGVLDSGSDITDDALLGVPEVGPGTDAGARGTCTKIDLLFVIDDSGSMEEEQTNLITSFPRFIDALDAFRTREGNTIDYRVGVTTTGRDGTAEVRPSFGRPYQVMLDGNNGALTLPAECPGDPWVESSNASRFACLADVGTAGPGVEMPLLASELALTARVDDGTNAGFLRDDALLAIVILTDEEDCSRLDDPMVFNTDIMGGPTTVDECTGAEPQLEPLTRFVDALDGVKGERGRWAVAAIAGPGPSRCESGFGEAQPANRLRSFIELAGDNGVFSSICDGDLAAPLTQALSTFEAACDDFPPLI